MRGLRPRVGRRLACFVRPQQGSLRGRKPAASVALVLPPLRSPGVAAVNYASVLFPHVAPAGGNSRGRRTVRRRANASSITVIAGGARQRYRAVHELRSAVCHLPLLLA